MNYIKETLEYLSKLLVWWVIVQPWEQGIRVRGGKKSLVMNGGTYFRIPFIDSVYVQETRSRIVEMSPHTISTKDKKILTVVTSVSYSIYDIDKLYNSIARPELTIGNRVLSEVANYIVNNNLIDCTPLKIQNHVDEELSHLDYGLKFESCRITGFAEMRAYRIIQDGHFIRENMSIEIKR